MTAAAFRERVVRIGASGPGLAGVVTEPTGAGEAREAVVMINSGILHRVGACRLHVKLARRLAAAGTPSLRFDHAGIGDSEARRDSLAFEKSAPLEIAEALDWLVAKRGIQRFVVFGLCSGADMGFTAALADPRIAGLVLLDPWAYRTLRHWWVHYRSRVTSLAAWRRLAARRLAPSPPAASAADDPELDVPTYVREFPPREQVAGQLASLVERGVDLLCIFSGGQLEDYNHQGQMRAGFRGIEFGERLEEHFLPAADHIFTGLEHQRTVLDRVVSWMARRGGEGAEAATPAGSVAGAGS